MLMQKGIRAYQSAEVSKAKSEALEYAKMMNFLPNRVEEIEQKRKKEFEALMKI